MVIGNMVKFFESLYSLMVILIGILIMDMFNMLNGMVWNNVLWMLVMILLFIFFVFILII